ncbi:iron permease [Roridomyces roridus]|uniref:Iron permease n=1 Tax=Roridomyces roridus TaxID=1738132 RepID=A0AAD7FN27_9AGAR|nr:iron permease [Roridomyces roridus]
MGCATLSGSTLNLTSDNSRSRTTRFWLVILAICSSLFLGALEFTAVSTALPTIVQSIPDFPSEDFVWVGSAYALAATAFLPMSGSLAQIFGRRPVVIVSLLVFAIGSTMCGAASTRNTFLAGRTIQGFGGGGILALTSIIIADLVPLQERGMYNGLMGITWSVAAAIGPVIGGILAEASRWRWLFYLNLPICGFVLCLVMLFLNLHTPRTSLREKLAQFDWIGISIIVSSSAAWVIALTWAGIVYPWSSFRVLVPFVLGLCGLVAFFAYEFFCAKHPIVSFEYLSNRTSLSGYAQTFMIQAVIVSYIYYMPIYFQACKAASPRGSGVDLFGLAMTLPPFSILGGASIKIFTCYRPQLWIGWLLTILSTGILLLLKSDSPPGMSIGFGVLAGAGMGVTYTATFFPVLAPLSVESNAHAISLAVFMRSFAQVCGITICGAVLQNGLEKNLPAEFLVLFPSAHDLAYGAVAEVSGLPEPLKQQVQSAFATSLERVWIALLVMSCAGFLCSIPMKGISLHAGLDRKWGVVEESEAMKDVTTESEEGAIEMA